MLTTRPTRILPLLAAFALSACGDDPTELEGFGTVVIQFDHVVDGAALAMNTGTYTNAMGNSYSVSKLEYVMSDFTLSRSDGDFEMTGQHYRDATDATTATLTLSDVPAGQYTTLTFVFGVPASVNTTGSLPDLDAAGMAWPAMMGGGYHYMRNEGAYTPTGGGTANFTTHTGPTMGADYTFTVTLTLPSALTLDDGESYTVNVEMDVNEWYTAPNDWDFNDYGLIMGNADAQTLLRANGASVWSAASVSAN